MMIRHHLVSFIRTVPGRKIKRPEEMIPDLKAEKCSITSLFDLSKNSSHFFYTLRYLDRRGLLEPALASDAA